MVPSTPPHHVPGCTNPGYTTVPPNMYTLPAGTREQRSSANMPWGSGVGNDVAGWDVSGCVWFVYASTFTRV